MDFFDKSTCKIQLFKGFVTYGIPQQQFSVVNASTQDVCLGVTNTVGSPYIVRMFVVHRPFNKKEHTVIGMTSIQQNDYEFVFAGRLPAGKIYFVPVAIRSDDQDTSALNRIQPIQKLIKKVGHRFALTPTAEEACEIIFNALDANFDCYLSKEEMGTFKECLLDYARTISDAEWDDMTCMWIGSPQRMYSVGWNELGDFDENIGMGFELFKLFLLRLASRSFTFINARGTTPITPPRKALTTAKPVERNLRSIFECFGLIGNCQQLRSSEYVATLYYRRGSVSGVKQESQVTIVPPAVVSTFTRAFGINAKIPKSSLKVYMFKTDDFCAISLSNRSEREVTVAVEMDNCKGVVPWWAYQNAYRVNEEILAPYEHRLVCCFSLDTASGYYEIVPKVTIAYMDCDDILSKVDIFDDDDEGIEAN